MSVTRQELASFHQFASEKLDHGGTDSTLEDLLRLWRQEQEYAKTVEDIREGIEDYAAGKAEPLAKAFRDIRRDLGLAE
jgi:hypothetical protein